MAGIRRRTALLLSLVGGLALASGVVIWRARKPEASTDPDTLARDYAARRARAEADYLAGRVVVWDGWIISQTEAEDIPAEPA